MTAKEVQHQEGRIARFRELVAAEEELTAAIDQLQPSGTHPFTSDASRITRLLSVSFSFASPGTTRTFRFESVVVTGAEIQRLIHPLLVEKRKAIWTAKAEL